MSIFNRLSGKKANQQEPELPGQPQERGTAPWRTFSIFISSTFADMQAERDYLKHVVIPRVEEKLQERRIKLEMVDLRWGVDTTTMQQEGEREANVLKVCLDEIRRCRPFFIGLLGDRYGWVPPAQRMENAVIGEDVALTVKGKSVTALEIEFGVLASHEQLTRSVFYLRNPLPYETFSATKAAMFSDAHNPALTETEKAERKAAFRNLKTSIRQHFENKKLKDKVKTYSATWDPAKETVTGLESWGDLVYTDILAECESHAKATWDQVPQNWQEQELALLDAFIEGHTHVTTFKTKKGEEQIPTFCGRKPLIQELKQHLLSGDSPNWGLALTGESGSGKSAVFSMMYKEMQQENCFILAHSAGLSPRAKSVASLLQIWNKQLSGYLGIAEEVICEVTPEDVLMARMAGEPGKEPATPIEKLQEKFLELLQMASAKRRVVLLIDALDRFEPTARAQHLSWLPGLMPQNVRLLLTAITGTEQSAVKYHKGLIERSIDVFSAGEAKEMLLTLCKRQHKTLPAKVVKAILEKSDDGKPATSSPLWLSLAANMMMVLDHDDFEKMSHLGGSGGEQIESYMATLALGFDPRPGPLFLSLVNKAGTVFGETFTRAVFDYLACSRNGLREKDLEKILPAGNITWDPLQFAGLRRWFRAHLIMQGEELQWNLAHSILKSALIQQVEEARMKEMHNTIADYLRTLSEDPLKSTETLYHLLNSGNLKEAALYYSGTLTPDEVTGATSVLAETITTDKSGIALACGLPSLLVNDLKSFHGLLKRFIYDLNVSLEVEGNLEKRLVLLDIIKSDSEKTFGNKTTEEGFGYDIAALSEKLGSIHQSMGHMEEALKYFDEEVRIFKELYEANPRSESLKNGLAISYERLGAIHQSMGHLEEALKYFEKRSVIGKELYDANPRSESLKNGLAISYSKLGDIHQSMGHMEEALKYFEKDLELTKELYEANPRNINLLEGLGISYYKLAMLYKSTENSTTGKERFAEWKSIISFLAKNVPQVTKYQEWNKVEYD